MMGTDPVDVEAFVSRDAEGAPTYNPARRINARVQRMDDVVQRPDGSMIATTYTVYVDAGQSPLPRWHDRIRVGTLGEYHTLIVEDHYEGKDLSGAVRHVRVRCREE